MKSRPARRNAASAHDTESALTGWIAVAIAIVMTVGSLFAAALG